MIFATEPKGYIAKARTRQKVTNTYRRLTKLTDHMSKAVQINLIKGIHSFKKKVNDADLLKAWKTGNYQNVMETIPWKELPKHLDPMEAEIGKTFIQAANFVIPSLPAPVQRRLRFDTKNPSIKSYLRSSANLITQNIYTDTQKIVQNAVTRSFNEALRPSDVSSMVKNSIGLLPKHEIAVDNYRKGLLESGMNVNKVQLLGDKYADRLLTYRANMIARTETRFATNYGQLSIWKEAANQDLIDRTVAKKVWIVDGDPCEICEPMDGIGVPLDESWTLNNGDSVDIPTESHPHCMCGMEMDFGKADEQPDFYEE